MERQLATHHNADVTTVECGEQAGEGWKCWNDGVKTYAATHTRDEHDAAPALRDHVARSLARGEESPVDVDIIQTLDAVERVADEGGPWGQYMVQGLHGGAPEGKHSLEGRVVLHNTYARRASRHIRAHRQKQGGDDNFTGAQNAPAEATTESTRPNVPIASANAFCTERSDETSHSSPMNLKSDGFESLLTWKVFKKCPVAMHSVECYARQAEATSSSAAAWASCCLRSTIAIEVHPLQDPD